MTSVAAPTRQISNRRLIDPNGPEFYPTPEWGTRALLKYQKFQGSILEPCCGDGSMSEVLEAAGYQVVSSDIIDRGYGEQRDFFEITGHVDNIVTNPPFNIAENILAHALEIADRKVCLLLRTAFLESRSRFERFYRANKPAAVLVFSERLSMYPKGAEATAGGTTSYAWFVWDKRVTDGRTEVCWIEPGLKPKSRK